MQNTSEKIALSTAFLASSLWSSLVAASMGSCSRASHTLGGLKWWPTLDRPTDIKHIPSPAEELYNKFSFLVHHVGRGELDLQLDKLILPSLQEKPESMEN